MPASENSELLINRRQLLKGLGSAFIFSSIPSIPNYSLKSHESLPSIPEDVLSQEALDKYRIRICSTENTQLYLRPSAFSVPIFIDSKNGVIDESVVVLVEDDYLSHETTRGIPEDARMLWDAIMPENMDEIQALRGFFARGGTKSYMYSDREKLEGFLGSHPEYEKRMYIFLAVGGLLTPHPDHSYPTSDMVLEGCEEQPIRDFDYYRFFPRPNNPAFVLLHECGHYHIRLSRGEWMADNYAIDMMTYNSDRYQTTGDTRSFPFVFVNNKGITVT